MSWSQESLNESFYMSNIVPQMPGFNRGIWKKLENKIRLWLISHGTLHITTGPILIGSDERIGENQVCVPRAFYKVVISLNIDSQKGIGFILPNNKILNNLNNYSVSIDSVELLTGIDFNYKLNKKDQETIESNFSISDWDE